MIQSWLGAARKIR